MSDESIVLAFLIGQAIVAAMCCAWNLWQGQRFYSEARKNSRNSWNIDVSRWWLTDDD